MKTEEFGILVLTLTHKDSGFYLVQAPDNPTLDDLMVKINVAMGQAGKHTGIINFMEMQGTGKSITSFVRDAVSDNPGIRVFFMRNMEAVAGDEPERFISNLNHAREGIYYLERNFIFMVYPNFAELFMRYAPDFMSWVPHKYKFEGVAFAPREFGASLQMEENTRFKGDKDRKYIRELIELYEEQLEQAPDDNSFRIRNIVEPLADLYEEYGDYAKEIPLRQEIVQFFENEELEYADSIVMLGNAYVNLPTGNRGEHIQKAIDIYKEALKIYTFEAFPADYAMIMNNLGYAYGKLPTGGRSENLQKAIDAYQEALKITTIEAFPVDYALTMNNLGTAYGELPTGDRGENLQKAIDAFQEALKIRTIEAFLVDYAMTMNNLGAAYQNLPTGDRGENLQKAIDAYQEALKIYMIEAFPVEYAVVTNNLGNAYRDLPTGDQGENLQKVIDAYQEALKIRTVEAFPADYAMTMYNLGLAYSYLPTGNRMENLQKAVDACNEALKVYTEKAFPSEHAKVKSQLDKLLSEPQINTDGTDYTD
ncbi:MAG: tetratricopeptide repeat protein [Desulfobacteraceae bacterium]|nr:tetratricopeptide repeat protein [Desulfobacteraceae bacterium]